MKNFSPSTDRTAVKAHYQWAYAWDYGDFWRVFVPSGDFLTPDMSLGDGASEEQAWKAAAESINGK